MMRNFLRLALLVTTAAMVISCADKDEMSFREKEQISLDAWIAEHVGDKAVRIEDEEYTGMYIVYPDEREPDIVPKSGEWMLINYKGYDLDGNVFMTRDSVDAYREGTLTSITRYRPLYLQFSTHYKNLPDGVHYIFDKGLIRKNEKVTLYLPSKLTEGFGMMQYLNGYGGSRSFPSGQLMKLEVELVDIIGVAPMEYEENLVRKYVSQEGWNLSARDTIAKNLYIHITYNVPEKDRVKIEEEDDIELTYEGYFLDGYLLDTNIGELAIDLLGQELGEIDPEGRINIQRDTTAYTNPQKGKRSEFETSWIDAFKRVFESDTLSYDCSFKMAFTSDYGYQVQGNIKSGSTSTYTEIQSYTPLVFKVRILPKPGTDEDEDKDKED